MHMLLRNPATQQLVANSINGVVGDVGGNIQVQIQHTVENVRLIGLDAIAQFIPEVRELLTQNFDQIVNHLRPQHPH